MTSRNVDLKGWHTFFLKCLSEDNHVKTKAVSYDSKMLLLVDGSRLPASFPDDEIEVSCNVFDN